MPDIRVEQVERAIQQLPTIYAVQVLVDDDNETIEKIHILASPERAPKKIVRDVETLLLLRFNLHIDYRRISLAQMQPQDVRPLVRPRWRLRAIDSCLDGPTQHVEVRLESETVTFRGRATGPADGGLVGLAAEAALDALRPVIREANVRLDFVEAVSVREETVILVAVTVGDPGREKKLLGSCFVRDDALAAAAQASLDAINRHFFEG